MTDTTVARSVVAALLGVLLLTGCATSETGASTEGRLAMDPAAVAPLERSTPQRVRVPTIAADSELMTLGLNPDRTLEVPPAEDAGRAGWYRKAATPGEQGPAVVVGHLDGAGQRGVFHRLREMRPGHKVFVERADDLEVEFTVTEVRTVGKDAFPTQQVYGPTPDAQLRLISCGGAFDRVTRSYEENVVVFATLSGITPT